MPGDDAKIRVLAVDDEPENLELLARSLRRTCEVLTAGSAEDALAALSENRDVSLILTDYRMPGMNGAELLARSRELYPAMKRVLITAYPDADTVLEAVNDGQAQYIIRKPFERSQLVDIVSDLANGNGHAREEAPSSEAALAVELDEARRALVRAEQEVGRLAAELEQLAVRDGLTGFLNHKAFQDRLREELSMAQRKGQALSLLYGDIDHFSRLNRELGHIVGDDILRRLGTIICHHASMSGLRELDAVGRFGGEEIAIVLPETDKAAGQRAAERIRTAVTISEFPQSCSITLSFGVATFPGDATDPDELIRCAERSMRAAKQAGRNQVYVYKSSDRHRVDPDEDRRRVLSPPRERFTPYHARLGEIVHLLERDHTVACLYVDLAHLRRVENEFGVARHVELFSKAGALLEALRGDKLRRDDLVCRTDDGDAYLCFLSPPRSGKPTPSADLDAIAQRVTEQVASGLTREVEDLLRDRPRVIVGYARVLKNPMIRPERLISRLVTEARHAADIQRERAAQREKTFLQEVILQEQLIPVYQPIVQLESGEVFGFEALTRGPRGSSLESPNSLFSVADEVDLTFELDRACFRGALRGGVGLEPVHRLFLNLLPLSFYDTSFIEVEVSTLLQTAGLTPANLVFEITERLAIENFASFRQALARYTALGFGVAIDDVGTRHSNLETVMALRPHFIKISDVLTRGISQSTVKREMLRSLQRIGEAIDAVIVAEGIETADDLAVLCDCGIRYGQGFYLARPGPAFPRVRPQVAEAVRALVRTPRGAVVSDLEDDDFRDDDTQSIRRAMIALDVDDDPHDDAPPTRRATTRSDHDTDSRHPERAESASSNGGDSSQIGERWRPLAADLGIDGEDASLLDSLRKVKPARVS